MTALLTAREVADLLSVSVETILRWHRSGKLPSLTLPSGAIRFTEDQIAAWIAERAAPSRGVSTAPRDAAHALGYPASTVPEVEE